MPVFHDQQRDALRRMYLEAWQRHQDGLPLTPLQAQLLAESPLPGEEAMRPSRSGLFTGLKKLFGSS